MKKTLNKNKTLKEQVIDRIISKYSGKTFTSSKDSLEYLRRLIDSEMTGYFNIQLKIEDILKNNIDDDIKVLKIIDLFI